VIDTSHYTYRVQWSAEDDEFVATVAEFPSLSWLAADQADALRGLLNLVGEVVADMDADENIPEPLSERIYSGKFNVRVTASLHRELAVSAAEEGVSLNRLVNDRLAHR
jgi:predicted HicB family RNase H-like nuclease